MVLFLFAFILLIVGNSFADNIYTWYYGKQLASFLETMNSYISSAEFVDLWKVAVGFSFILLLFAVIASAGDYRQSIRLLKFYGTVVVLWFLLVTIKVDVNVIDKCTKSTYNNIQAPWIIGKPLSWFSTIEGSVRNGIVSFFGIFLPDAYKKNEGCFTGYELLRPALTYQPKNPYLRLSIENYIRDCIIPTVLAGDIDRISIVNSNDLWSNEFVCGTGKLCVALTTTYYNRIYPEGIVETCPNAYARISTDLANEYSLAWKDIKAKIFGSASAVAETEIPVYLGQITPFLMSVALTGENLIRQAITIQALNQVSAEFATAIAYQEAYLSALARLNMLDFGRGGTLNAMKGIIGAILVGLTPAFAILFITPIGARIFYGWITAFLWLVLWSIAEVITVSLLFLSVGDNQKFDFTLSQIDRLNLAFNKAAQISSLMSDFIPVITLFLATGSLYAMTQFAKGMSGELREEHGTKVMASGNFEAGNVRVRGYSDLTTALANSTVGAVSQNTANINTFSGNTTGWGNVTIGTETHNTFSKPYSLGMSEGYATGYRTDKGDFVSSFVGSDGFRAKDVFVDKNGMMQPVGKGTVISAPSGEVLMRNLSTLNPSLTADIRSFLADRGLSESDLRAVSLVPTEKGMKLSFMTGTGGEYSVILGEGNYAGHVTVGGVGATVTDQGIISVHNIPRRVEESEILQKIGQRERAISEAVNRLKEKTEGWSETSRAVYSALVGAFARGEISAEEVEKTWQALKEIEDGYRIGLGGSAGTSRKSPVAIGLSEILKRLPSKVQKVLPKYLPGIKTYLGREGGAEAGITFGGREKTQVGEGGRVGSLYGTGRRGEETQSFGTDFSKIISENLRYAENELKSIRDTFSEIQSKGLSMSKDVVPALIDVYAKENNLSVDSALKKLSENNWKELDNLINRFVSDSEFRRDVLEMAKERTESAGYVDVDTSNLEGRDIRGDVEKQLADQKDKVEGGLKNLRNFAGQGIARAKSEGESTEGKVEESLSNRETIAKALAGAFFASSLLGLFPRRSIPRGGGTEIKSLPGGKKPPEVKPPPSARGSFPELEGINKPEQLKEYAKRYGIELTDSEAQRMIELREQLIRTNDPVKRVGILQEMDDIARKAFERNPEAVNRIQKNISSVVPNIEKSIIKQVGEEGAKSILKKIPLTGLAVGAYFAYERAQAGDVKGAILELASGIASTFPGPGTLVSMGIDGYLLARDMGIVDDKVSREEFNKEFNKALLQARNLSGEELKQQIWNNSGVREQVLDTMRTDPNFYLNYEGKPIRLDEEGNIYDYSALAERGLSVNTQGQLYDVNTGRIVKNADKNEFIVGRI